MTRGRAWNVRGPVGGALAAVLVTVVIVGACSDGASPASTVAARAQAATTTTGPGSSVAPVTTTTPPTTAARAEAARSGLGDSRYPGLGNGGYDVDHYTLDLSFDPEPARLAGIATIEATAEERLDAFNLDFYGMETLTVAIDDEPATFTHSGHELTLTPVTPIPAGESFTVAVDYAGPPAPIPSQASSLQVGWRSAQTGEQYVVSEPDGAHTWFPANDHPLDKATYTFRVTVPSTLVAVANGIHVDTVTDVGAATWVYQMPQPMASYLATVVIGRLQVVEDADATAEGGVPIRNVLPSAIAEAPPPALERQGEMMAFLVERFGPYPFDLYGIAVVPEFPAALENQTLSVFGSDFMEAPFLDFVLVHELAHQWFGDHVTPGDWGDIWLNEGFATYAEWLWLERREGAAALDMVVAATRDALFDSGLPPPGDPPADDLLNASVYQWGGLTLHALRREIGDDAFFATLRTYVDRFGGGNATTTDFVAVAEEVAGAELDDLFDAWLYGDAPPEL